MTNEGENVGDDPMVDLRSSDLESDDPKDELDDPEAAIPILAEAWYFYAVAVPERENQYGSRRRQHEWEVTRHDRCRGVL